MRYEDDRIEAINVWTPVRGKPLKCWELSRELNPQAFRALLNTLEGNDDISVLTPEESASLLFCGILIQPQEISRHIVPPKIAQLNKIEDILQSESTRAHLQTLGYAIFDIGLTDHELNSLRDYYRDLLSEGWVALGDAQSNRYWIHNDPVGRDLLALCNQSLKLLPP